MYFFNQNNNRLTRRVSLVEQELLTLPGHLSLPPVLSGGSCYSIFSCMCICCRSLFVLLYLFFWPLCCLFLFNIRILITPLVSWNSSMTWNNWVSKYIWKSIFGIFPGRISDLLFVVIVVKGNRCVAQSSRHNRRRLCFQNPYANVPWK